jgi:hypothetical protein
LDKKQIKEGQWLDPTQHPGLKRPITYYLLLPFFLVSHRPRAVFFAIIAFGFWIMVAGSIRVNGA